MSNDKKIKTREEAKEVIFKALDDENLDLIAFGNHVSTSFGCICGGTSGIDVTNMDDVPVQVAVSKTCGVGEDGFYTIESGKTERWSRCVFRVITIKVEAEGPSSVQHTVGISTAENTFNIVHGRLE